MAQRRRLTNPKKVKPKPAFAKEKPITEKIILSPKEQKRLDGEFLKAAEEGGINDVKRLYNAGADIDARDKDGKTALMYFGYAERAAICKFLLEKGANVAVKDDRGINPLMWNAWHSGEPEICDMLIEKLIKLGGDARKYMEAIDERGETALHFTAFEGGDKMCRYLLEKYSKLGGDVKKYIKTRGSGGSTPLNHAASEATGDVETCNVLFEFLEKAGGSVREYIESREENGSTALMTAAANGKLEICELLIERLEKEGEDVKRYIETTNYFGTTALMNASWANASYVCPFLLRKLVESGGDAAKYLDARNNKGETALMMAAEDEDDKDTIKMLAQELLFYSTLGKDAKFFFSKFNECTKQ